MKCLIRCDKLFSLSEISGLDVLTNRLPKVRFLLLAFVLLTFSLSKAYCQNDGAKDLLGPVGNSKDLYGPDPVPQGDDALCQQAKAFLAAHRRTVPTSCSQAIQQMRDIQSAEYLQQLKEEAESAKRAAEAANAKQNALLQQRLEEIKRRNALIAAQQDHLRHEENKSQRLQAMTQGITLGVNLLQAFSQHDNQNDNLLSNPSSQSDSYRNNPIIVSEGYQSFGSSNDVETVNRTSKSDPLNDILGSVKPEAQEKGLWALSPDSDQKSGKPSGLDRFDPTLGRFDAVPPVISSSSPPDSGRSDKTTDGMVTDQKIADNQKIQHDQDAANPPSVTIKGPTLLDFKNGVESGQIKPNNGFSDKPDGPIKDGVIIQITAAVAFSEDRKTMYREEHDVYRVEGETEYHVIRRIITTPTIGDSAGLSDETFVLNQTVFIRMAEARALPPTQAPEGFVQGNSTIVSGGGETFTGKVADLVKPALDYLDNAAAEKLSKGQWMDPWPGGEWEPFPTSLAYAGYEPGPGGLRTVSGVKVFLHDKQVPNSWFGGDDGK